MGGLSMMFEERGAYQIAVSKAIEDLGGIDPGPAAAERGVQYDADQGLFRMEFLREALTVGFPGGEVRGPGDERLSGAVVVIALHYLTYRGEPLRAEGWLAFRDMPGGRVFSSAFEQMSEEKLAFRFGASPDEFAAAALRLGGEPAESGEFSFLIPALPRLPLHVILWPECEGVEGAARVLFPPRAPYYLHTEDLAALGAVAAERLIAVGAKA